MNPKVNNRISKKGQKATCRGSWKISRNLLSSFKYAAQGLIYSFSSQRNFRIHIIIGACVFGIALWLNLSVSELAILVLTIASVVSLELINTSIEALTDLAIGRRFHPLARVAKDCAAAAVSIAAISSLVIACLLILPKLFIQIGL